MSMLRLGALAIALAAVLDPELPVRRSLPATVQLHFDVTDRDAVTTAERLRRELRRRVDFVDEEDVAAQVVIGNVRPDGAVFSRPVSVVTLDDAPSVAIAGAPAAVQANVNTETAIPITLHARGLAGQTTVVTLEDAGVELSRAELRWTGEGGAAVALPFLALSPGARTLTIRATAAPGEHRVEDNRADILAMSSLRPARVAVVEPRPSWPAGFVRRALEDDPAFRVASILRTSIDVETRAGESPRAVAFEQLTPFDVVIVGTPEALRRNELEALRRFAEERGGTVVLLPDQRPSGPYAELLPSVTSEQLLAEPRMLEPAGIPASEIVSVRPMADIRSLATLNDAPVVFSWPVGDGRFLFSGALDAWRYRADQRSRTLDFWRDTLMAAALDSPPALRLEVVPAVVRPGGLVRVTARVRKTEFVAAADDASRTFTIEGHVTNPRGQQDLVRLHPTADVGTLEAEVPTALPGVHSVMVRLANGARSEITFVVEAEAAAPPVSAGLLEDVPALTGGVVTSSNDFSPLADHLASLRRPSGREDVHPMRSPWWMLLFATLLCAEWTMRRRRGLR
jgi:hypothetical protein